MAAGDPDTNLIERLVEDLVEAGQAFMPVREMEKVLAVGAAAIEPLARIVRSTEAGEFELPGVWASILLGELRAASAAGDLVNAIVRVPDDAFQVRVPAAEALAWLGVAALPAIRALAASESESNRLWAYCAAGLTREAWAFTFLLEALESDPGMRDVIGSALGDHGDRAAIEPLYRALALSEPWQWADIEDAIRELHGGVQAEQEEDWRLRYRLNQFSGWFPFTWVVITAIVREGAQLRERTGPPPSLDEILASVAQPEEELCECCSLPTWSGTGVPVCPMTAATVPALQARQLKRRFEATGTDDVFEMLDEIEADMLDMDDRPQPRSRRARERLEDEETDLRMQQRALMWAIGRGTESVRGACAMLLAEGARAAAEHGDPDGVFERVSPPATRPVRGAGRNDPCPCGSGRKYKKCCGRSHASSPGNSTRRDAPELVTAEHDPVVFSRAHYDVTDVTRVVDALRLAEDIVEVDDGSRFAWIQRIDEEDARSLGVIDLSRPGRLVLECMSRERLARGRRMLEDTAGTWLVHRMDTEQDPWQAMESVKGRGTPTPEPDEVPPEIAGPIMRRFMDRHYREWPDKPLPALGGRTAREAARTVEGRRKVIGILEEMHDLERQKSPELRYDFAWLWKDLGLDRWRSG